MRSTTVAVLIACLTFAACDEPVEQPDEQQPDEQAGVDYRWMPEDDAEKFLEIENQFAGFSATMEEVGYRYTELYWAGQNRNWDYADYQLEKIESAIERGVIRRTGREDSARQYFLDDEVPALADTITAEDEEQFDEQFEAFTSACNTCHVEEDVEFIQITYPTTRQAPVAPQPDRK